MLTKFLGSDLTESPKSPDEHPAERYLATLGSEQSTRTMRTALNNVAVMHGARSIIRYEHDRAGREKKHDVTYLTCDWSGLTAQHVLTIRSNLSKLYQPASVNKMLSALRGVLEAAYDLGV